MGVQMCVNCRNEDGSVSVTLNNGDEMTIPADGNMQGNKQILI